MSTPTVEAQKIPVLELPFRLAYRPNQAAKMLSIGTRKLWELTNRGLIPHVKIDRMILYPHAGLVKWLTEQTKAVDR